MKRIWILMSIGFVILFSGCASTKYNGGASVVKNVNYPKLNNEVTAFIGDHLLEKGVVYQEKGLRVNQLIDGVAYDIPPKYYPPIGYDDKYLFFNPTGVVRGAIFDPFESLALQKTDKKQLCVVTVFGGTACYDGDWELVEKVSERGKSFQQTLIYSGKVGNKINISYREFSNNRARPAFNNDVEYDLSESKTIGYKGALIEVINANNSSITYRVIRNFK